MRGLILLLLAGVMLCCLGFLLSLPATATSAPESPAAFAGTDAAQEVDGGANAPLPDVSYPITPAEELKQADQHPVNASLLVDATAEFILRGECLMDAHNRSS